VKTRFLLPALLSTIVVCGCASRDPRGARFERVSNLAVRQETAPSVRVLDEQGLQKLVRNRNGKILLLNFWATWCQPCVEEFPDLIRLSKSYSKNELEVVGVSVDYPDETETKVAPFLKKHRVPFVIYVAKFDKQEDFINSVDTSWSGAVPATFIYDPQGIRRFSLIGQSTYSVFKREIEKVNARTMP
jgi:thiol-disulfide isomerase/thioredoxin